MRMAHDPDAVDSLRAPAPDKPWRALVSGCMLGWGCGVDGTDYGMGGTLADFFGHPLVETVPFCPEDVALGTPRGMPDLHGGDGFAVLDGEGRALDEKGNDLSWGMIEGAAAMTRFAQDENVDFAVLTDMSGACGTQVIPDGCRFDEPRKYQQGVGVAAAMLIRARIPVVSQRDFRTLGALWKRIDPGHAVDADARDHHESDWYVDFFR
ncbi:MAG: 2-thiouracil desulfurase family protein [Planctomycetota bacterium]|jgi:uncharacterized protein YbbK (DUF523 family)